MEPDILILRQVWDFLTICWMDLPVMGSLISVSESMVIFRWMTITQSRIQELFWELH